jgi:RNA polymerase sigma factor (sigma-70 family)
MASRFPAEVWIRRAAREADSRPDALLLQLFLHHRDHEAFAVLVRRHGPTVLGVCRRLLGDRHDVEDAFQATFLVLVRKARRITRRDRLGGWLYGVAFRTAQKARFRRARQRAVERPADEATPEPAAPAPPPNDWMELLDRELLAVPEKYRLPLLLCELRGLSRRDAARQLGLAEGTLSSRLARGRQLLRQRLSRRGVTLSAAALLGGLASQARADFSPALVGPIVQTAASFVTNRSLAAGAVPVAVLHLTEGVLKSMFLSKLKIALLVLPVLALGAWGFHAAAAKAPPAQEEARPADPPRPPAPAAKPARDAQRVVALIFDDIPITREELGEYLVARYGAEKLPQLVNRRIIEHVCAQKGIGVTEREIEAALEEELAQLKVSRADFQSQVLKAYGKSLHEWREDVLRPKLLMGKLCRRVMTASEAELRAMFEHLYGKKARCKWLAWRKEEGHAARRWYEENRQRPEAFEAKGLEVAVIGRPIGDEMSPLAEEAFKLKPGEVSPLRTTKDSTFFIIQCLGFVPAVEGKTFDEERPRLLKEVLDRKIAAEMPRLFKEYRDAARPKILLRREGESPTAADSGPRQVERDAPPPRRR